jgi:multiple sugar transport system permease protein/putative aldouronate transport system permease protein
MEITLIKKKKPGLLQRYTYGDRIFHVICFVWIAGAGILVLYPLIYTISCSLSAMPAILQGKVVLWPVGFNVDAYKEILRQRLLVSGFFNSIYYTAGSVVVSISLVLLAAYPLSRKDLPDRKLIQTIFVITMFFGGGLIPNYLLVRNLGLIGTRASQFLIFAFSCWNMILVKTYFQHSLPDGLLEAAHIDGCGDVRYFFTFAIPLSIPVIAVMILNTAVGSWNGFFNGILYLSKSSQFNYQMVLREILSVATLPPEMLINMDPEQMNRLRQMEIQLKYSALVVGAAPMMMLYPFVQKYFLKGVMLGSLKE